MNLNMITTMANALSSRCRQVVQNSVIMDYLAVIVSSDNTRLSQLRNAHYKVMANYYSWEKSARNVCGNFEDDEMQGFLMNLGRRGSQRAEFLPELDGSAQIAKVGVGEARQVGRQDSASES
ncbi:unnamed protein product [Symbiodinium sp. CCMP2456]|nr:unnamed protein product [Symbiodinium sp. CCMP2456]